MHISSLAFIIYTTLISMVGVYSSCRSQAITHQKSSDQTGSDNVQLSEYVVEAFEDSNGNLWFGTIGNGAARYDGKTLSFLTTKDGLIGDVVTSFAEDKEGNLWIGTHSGLARYDGKTFTNYASESGLVDDRVSELLFDTKGILWVGTWKGVSRFDGAAFTTFVIPIPDIELLPYQTTMNWITEIIEDKKGNIWFGRDGYGACSYDGISFTHYTKQNGLASNCVQIIQEDMQGNLWFGSRVTERDNPNTNERIGDGGLTKFDGKIFTQFQTIQGLNRNDIYAIGVDNKGSIWIGANKLGLYRYDGENFHLLRNTDRYDLMPHGFGFQSILEDSKGNVWLGLSGGLFRLHGDSIINVTPKGPWD